LSSADHGKAWPGETRKHPQVSPDAAAVRNFSIVRTAGKIIIISSYFCSNKKGAVSMLQTIEAVTDQYGVLKLLEPIKLPKSRRILITILDEEPSDEIVNSALLSEPALARDWERSEEDEAWLHLAQLPSL
jgi:predicted DNA-binding antitoxin AbrB/MazE fold protein